MKTLMYIANLRLPTEKAYGIQITKMCEALADQGAHIFLVVPTRRNPIATDIFTYYGVRKNFGTVRLFSPDFYLPSRLDRIAVHIKNFISAVVLASYALTRRVDAIYSRDELPLYLLSFLKKNLTFEAHTYSHSRTRYYRRFKRAGIKIVAISGGIHDAFIGFGFPSEKILVAHDGVDINEFAVHQSTVECRELLGLPQDKKIVLYAGHLYERKGAHVLAEAAKKLDGRYVVLFVGGTTRDVAKYRNLYGGHKSILFHGWRPHKDIPLYLKAADIVVLPNSGKGVISRMYTSPLKLFEYMASGKPIIASDLPSSREVLTENMAHFFRPDDPESLTNTINEVITNISEADKRARQAFVEVAQYSWASRAQKIVEFIT